MVAHRMIRNPAYNRSGGIDCEVNHPQLGWIPFTARMDDPEAYGAQVYRAALAMGPADYVATDPDEILAAARDHAVLTKRAFCLQLLDLGILPPDEAEAASRGEWPATFASFTAGMSSIQAIRTRIEWAGATVVEYGNPLLQGLALAKANGNQAAATALLDAIFGITA